MLRLSLFVLAIILTFVGGAAAQEPPAQGAVLRAVDRVNARTILLDAVVGRPLRFGKLEILVRACEPDPRPLPRDESRAFLEIHEFKTLRATGDKNLVFSGWMIASDPAVSGLEHPTYDVWLINCKT